MNYKYYIYMGSWNRCWPLNSLKALKQDKNNNQSLSRISHTVSFSWMVSIHNNQLCGKERLKKEKNWIKKVTEKKIKGNKGTKNEKRKETRKEGKWKENILDGKREHWIKISCLNCKLAKMRINSHLQAPT